MTIEGRPEIQTSDEYWQNEYSRQRKDRMQDAIDDYLQDNKVSARQTYEEMLSCVQDVIDYHKKQMDRAVELKSLMMGHREVDFADEIAEKWQYDKLPERF
jgi:predicted house-cleaning noncanonical NTP pyrophosphatase (MazG superfamily)